MRESPETLIVPDAIEDHRCMDLELCDSCHWSCTFLGTSDGRASCPQCGNHVSHIPITTEEVCQITIDKRMGMVLEFSRRSLAC